MNGELIINNNGQLYVPAVLEDVNYSTERYGTPGKLTFKVLQDETLKFEEGNAVRFRWQNNDVFFGFIFSLRRDKENVVNVTAYDQTRYLKNKDTYVYQNKTASEVLQLIANDFNLQCGDVEDTGFKIATRVEDNQTLFDIIQNALDLTMENRKEIYVLYDDFGKLTLKSLENMRVNVIIAADTAGNFQYSSSIDGNTYNKIKLVYDNARTGQRDFVVRKDNETINKWGVLQYYDTLQEGENGKAKADALLSLYNQKTKTLRIKNAFGDCRVRAGSLICVSLDLGDTVLNNWMLVESCKHVFKHEEHFMDLNVRGGDLTE